MLLRSQLAVSGARDALVSHWAPGQESELRKILVELTHDERVMAAAACGADGSPRAATADYPAALSCRSLGPRVHPDPHSPARGLDDVGLRVLGAGRAGARHRRSAARRRAGARLRGAGPRPQLRRTARGDDPAVPAAGLRIPGARGVGDHHRRRAPVVARLEQRTAPVDPGRTSRRRSSSPSCVTCASWSSASPPEREADGQAACGRPQRLKNTLSRHLHGERVVDRREPRAVHPRAHERRRRRGAPPRERPGHGARARDARLLRRLDRPRERARPTARRSTPTRGCACRPARTPTCFAGCGSRPRRRRATTTASRTRGSGRSATSPTPDRSSAATTGATTGP